MTLNNHEITEKPSKFFEILNGKEGKLALSNISLYMFELFRDYSHFSSEDSILGKNLPIKTEGIAGFIDQHIGSSAEAIAFMFISRPIIELISKVIETNTNKKISANIKVGTSIFVGALIPSLMELGILDIGSQVNVQDPLDVFGPLVAASWALTSWKIINKNNKEKDANNNDFKLLIAGLWASKSEEVNSEIFGGTHDIYKKIKTKIKKIFLPTKINQNKSN